MTWLLREVETLAQAAKGRFKGRTALNQYRHGVVDTLRERLQETAKTERAAVWAEASEQRETDTGAALMRLDQLAEVEKAKDRAIAREAAKLHLRRSGGHRARRDDGARSAGRRDGQGVSLGSRRGALGGGRGRLSS